MTKDQLFWEVIMFEVLEKILLTGLGAVSLSQKKVDELLAELREKYKMSEEEGRSFVEKAQSLAREGREKLTEAAEAEIKKAMERMGCASRDELESLRKRVEVLEERIKMMGREADARHYASETEE
jgi:polyhydroxyalkanoate synthesis regulator phasin